MVATTIDYLSDGDHEVAEYAAGATTPSKRFIYGKNVDEIIAQHEPATNSYSYAHRNHQGSVVAVSKVGGLVASSDIYTYSPYGEPNITTGFPYRYTGRRLDTETGLYYYRARYYDAQLGRFLQTDPVGYEDQMNLYAYTRNDPVNNADPTGKNTAAGAAAGCAVSGPACPAGAAVGAVIGTVAMVAVAAVAVNNASDAIDSSGESSGSTESESGSTSPTGKPAPINGATWTNTTGRKGTDVWDKPGSFEDAVGDAEGLSEGGLTDRGNGVSTGTDANGNEIVVRPGGGEYTGGKEKGERANGTIEIKPPRVDGEKPPPPTDKIRYR